MNGRMNDQELLRLADLNLIEFWCASANWIPYPEIIRREDILLINSAIDFDPCNFAFNLSTTDTHTPDAFIDQAKLFFKNRNKSFSLLLRTHMDQALIQKCKDGAAFHVSSSPGMVLDKAIQDRSIPKGAELLWVKDEESLKDFRQVVSEAYLDLMFPEKISQAFFHDAGRILEPNVYLALIKLDGEPACTALFMLSHGIAGVYWVGTRKFARGLGLASYCTREVSNMAFDCGARKVVLQASKFGEPVYKKLGFREITKYPWYICQSE